MYKKIAQVIANTKVRAFFLKSPNSDYELDQREHFEF